MCDYLSITKGGPRPQSNQYFQMEQVARCYLIPVILFPSLSEVLPRKAHVPEATSALPAEYSQRNEGRHALSVTKAANKDMGEIRLQNVNKSSLFQTTSVECGNASAGSLTRKRRRGGGGILVDRLDI